MGSKNGIDIYRKISLLQIVKECIADICNHFWGGGTPSIKNNQHDKQDTDERGGVPNESQEEVYVINFWDLIYEGRNILNKFDRIMIHDEI